jgi:hypothetical protein
LYVGFIQTNASIDKNVTPVKRASNANAQEEAFGYDNGYDDDQSVFTDGSYVNGLTAQLFY